MKTKIDFLIVFVASVFFLPSAALFAQTDSTFAIYDSSDTEFSGKWALLFSELDYNELQTGILIDRAINFVDYVKHQGDTTADDNGSFEKIIHICNAALMGNVNATLPFTDCDSLMKLAKWHEQNGMIPLSILHFNFDHFKPNIFSDSLITFEDGVYLDMPNRNQSPFETMHTFMSAATVYSIYDTSVTFILPEGLFLDNSGKTLDKIEIDFDDGNSWQEIEVGTPITITYQGADDAQIYFKVKYSDLFEFTGDFLLKKSIPNYYILPDITKLFTASENHSGALVSIAYGCGNKKITKPLIVVEGFDPPQLGFRGSIHFNTGSLPFIKQIPLNLRQELESEGYDIIYIDFNDGADWIERNAKLFQEVLDWVNTEKNNNGSTQPNTVLGFSMGGVIARYGLRDYERNNIDHQTRLFFSVDAPHQGAYIPLSMQYLLVHYKHMSQISPPFGISNPVAMTPQIQLGIDILSTPAAKQLLTMNLFDPGGARVGRHSTMVGYEHKLFYDKYDNWLNLQLVREVAIASGSEIQKAQQDVAGNFISNNGTLLTAIGSNGSTSTGSASTDVNFELNGLPNKIAGKLIYKGKIIIMASGTQVYEFTNLSVYSNNNTLCYDNSPGGVYDLERVGIDINAVTSLPVPVTINSKSFSFVPATSALDLGYTDDLFYDIQGHDILGNNLTTLKNYAASNQQVNGRWNEFHTDITTYNLPLYETELLDYFPYNLSSTLQNTEFNYGYYSYYGFWRSINSHAVTDRLHSITVSNEGKLMINNYSGLRFTSDNLHEPDENSSFSVYAQGVSCGQNATVNIDEDGELIIGDDNATHAVDGRLYITEGSTINLKSGSKLTIHNNSQLIIMAGATFNFYDGAEIELKDNNSQIIIEEGAILHIASNTTFTFTGNGFIKFFMGNTPMVSITSGSNSKISLTGSGATDKVLEIVPTQTNGGDYLNILSGLEEMTVTNGLILMQENCGLFLESPLILTNTTVTAASAEQLNKGIVTTNGVELYGATIKWSYDHGLTAYQSGSVPDIIMRGGTTIKENVGGLRIVDGGCDIAYSHIKDNFGGNGLDCEGMSRPCTLHNTYVTNNEYSGIYYSGTSNSPLDIYYSTINENGDKGVQIEGSTVFGKCAAIHANETEGVFLGTNATANFDPTYFPHNGYVNLSDNYTGIYADAGYAILLNNSYSSLITRSPYNYTLEGTLSNSSNPFNANNNYWTHISPYVPVNGVHYEMYDLTPTDITLTTTTYLNSAPDFENSCPVEEEEGGGGGQGKRLLNEYNLYSAPTFPDAGNYRLNNPAMKGMDMQTAINSVVADLKVNDKNAAIDKLELILSEELENAGTFLIPVISFAYENLHKLIGEIFKDGNTSSQSHRILDRAILVQDNLLKNSPSGFSDKFRLTFDKAMLYRLRKDYQNCLMILKSTVKFSNPKQTAFADFWICKVEQERLLFEKQISLTQYDTQCQNCNRNYKSQRAAFPKITKDQIQKTGELNEDFRVYPNPSNGLIFLSSKASIDCQIKIEFIDLTGKLCHSEMIENKGVLDRTMRLTLGSGIYLYRITQQESVYLGRLIIE